ncbi:MAG: hypothetical protein ABIT70_10960, partial [Sulfuriferula sp.]
PGESLRIVRRAVGLRPELEDSALLEVQILEPGVRVKYITLTWVRVALPDGDEVEVHVSALEMIEVPHET